MASFFVPSHGSTAYGEMVAHNAGISEGTIDPEHRYVRLGLWGGVSDGSKLTIKVHRNSTVIGEGKLPAVKLQAEPYNAAQRIQMVTLYGLKQGDFIRTWDKNNVTQTALLPKLQPTSRAASLMDSWANGTIDPLPHGLCDSSTPYPKLSHPKYGRAPKLDAVCADLAG